MDRIVSMSILVIMLSIVALFTWLILTRPLVYFQDLGVKARIKNLYLYLSTFKRSKLAYALLFYLQRTVVIGIVATNLNYGIQTALLQVVSLFITGYLITVKPYLNSEDSKLEILNQVTLLISLVFQILFSPWSGEPVIRYNIGLAFDGYIALCFTLNIAIMAVQVVKENVPKLK